MVFDVSKKIRTTLTIDDEVLRTAMQIGINVSQFCENALRDGIERLKSPKNVSEGKSISFSRSSGSLSKRESDVEPPAGFGPATITLPRREHKWTT